MRNGGTRRTEEREWQKEPPWRKWLRVCDAAIYLGVSVSKLNKLRVTGGGPAFAKLGSVVVYDRDDLDRWATSHRVLSTSQNPAAAA